MPDRREFIGYIGSGTIWKVSALDAGGGESLGTQSSRGVSDSEDPAEEPTADALFRDEFNDGTFEDQWSYVEDQRHQGSSVVEAGTTLRHVTPQNYGSNKPIRTDSTIETSGTHRIVMRARTNRSDYNGWGIGVRGEQGGVALKNNKWGPFDRFAVFGVTERPDKYASDHGGSEQPNRAKLAPATSETSFSTYSITVDFDDNTVTRVQRDSRTWELSLPTGEIGDSYQLKIPIGGGHDVEYDFVTVIEVTAGAAPFTRIEVTPSPPAVNSSVNFTAANATASEGRTVSSYEWDFTGDDTVDATGREVSHTFREPGTYTIAVTLTDSEGVTATATKEISVIGAPSVAVDVTPTDPVTGVPVTFDATSATADEERKLTSHEWDITGDGTVDATGEEVTHSFAEPGTYAVTLTVTDSEGATATTTRDITVVAPPSADIELSSASPTVDRPVTLTATNVTAGGDRTVATYEWDFAGDGTIDATGEEVTHSFAEPGTYTVTLTVTDSEGATATTTREITVIAAPSAVIEVRPSDPVAGELITFSATDSTVAQSRSLTGFEWAFGDDNTFTESEDIVIRRFGESGNYTVRLRVTDSAGVSDTTSVTVTVDQPPSPTPTAPPTPTVSPTPTETPTKTPTETPTPEPASALGTGMSLRELLLGGVGVTGLGILGGVAYRRRSGGEETDSNSGSDTTPGEQAYELAEPALEEADTARQSGDYETAIDQYDEAITQYEIARDRLPTGDDRQEEIEYALSTTRESLRELQDYVGTRSDVTEMLTTAESDLQTALTGHTGGEVTVPELRYRQARDRYKKVLDTITDSDHDLFEDGPIEITRDTATATPPQDIENVPAYGDGQTLAEAGIDSAEAFVNADDDTLSTLADVHQMVATAWWDSEVTTTFASRADIETRREIAQRGFDQI